MDTKISDLLHGLAGEMPVDPGLRERMLRRARRRRRVNASLSSIVVIGLVLGAFVGIRGALDIGASARRPLAGQTSTPTAETPFRGIWPETNAEELAVAQHKADAGQDVTNTDSQAVAAAFVTSVLGWPDGGFALVRDPRQDIGALYEATETFYPIDAAGVDAATAITLEQLGKTGDGGVWTVTHVVGGNIVLDSPSSGDVLDPVGELVVSGHLPLIPAEGIVRVTVYDNGGLNDVAAIDDQLPLNGGKFEGRWPTSATSDGSLTLLVRALDANGATIAATAFSLTVGNASPTPSPVASSTLAGER